MGFRLASLLLGGAVVVVFRVELVVLLGAAPADKNAEPKFPPLPVARWEMTGNGYDGKLVVCSAHPVAQEPAVLEVCGTIYGERITGLYDRRNGRLRFVRGTSQEWVGDLDPKTLSVKGRFYPLTPAGGPPTADGYAWETTAAPKVCVPFVEGLSRPLAEETLKKAGLVVAAGTVTTLPGNKSDGWVKKQWPKAGTEVDPGAAVTLDLVYGPVP